MALDSIYLKEVASIIRQQLNTKITEVWAWGSKDWFYLERKVDELICPALMFSIRTPKVRQGGRVIISLNEGADEYIIEAIQVRGNKQTIIGKQAGVYAEDLHRIINSLIEDKETYTHIMF